MKTPCVANSSLLCGVEASSPPSEGPHRPAPFHDRARYDNVKRLGDMAVAPDAWIWIRLARHQDP